MISFIIKNSDPVRLLSYLAELAKIGSWGGPEIYGSKITVTKVVGGYEAHVFIYDGREISDLTEDEIEWLAPGQYYVMNEQDASPGNGVAFTRLCDAISHAKRRAGLTGMKYSIYSSERPGQYTKLALEYGGHNNEADD